MSKSSLPSWLVPVVLFTGMLVALQWPQISRMIWGDSTPEPAFTWQHEFETAQSMAEQEQKQVLAVFSASWCPPCRRMKQTVWPDAQVGEAVQSGYVPVYLDVDLPENETLVERYQVQGIPAVFILKTNGQVVRRANFLSSSDMLSFLAQ